MEDVMRGGARGSALLQPLSSKGQAAGKKTVLPSDTMAHPRLVCTEWNRS